MYALESQATIRYYSHKPWEIILTILHVLLPLPPTQYPKKLKTLERLNFTTLLREKSKYFPFSNMPVKSNTFKVTESETDMRKEYMSYFLILVP